jgi:hypothetical protein
LDKASHYVVEDACEQVIARIGAFLRRVHATSGGETGERGLKSRLGG